MSRRRRLIIMMGGNRLTDITEQEIGEIQFIDPLNQESIEWDDEEISEANLTSEQVDCLNNAATQFPDDE